jgi:hypothetical protein
MNNPNHGEGGQQKPGQQQQGGQQGGQPGLTLKFGLLTPFYFIRADSLGGQRQGGQGG